MIEILQISTCNVMQDAMTDQLCINNAICREKKEQKCRPICNDADNFERKIESSVNYSPALGQIRRHGDLVGIYLRVCVVNIRESIKIETQII